MRRWHVSRRAAIDGLERRIALISVQWRVLVRVIRHRLLVISAELVIPQLIEVLRVHRVILKDLLRRLNQRKAY